MSKNLLRTLATLLVAFGLIAGSLGTAVAGFGLEVLNPEGEIETDGGDGGDGGDAGNQDGTGTNTNSNNQGNDQDQSQDPTQNQDVGQNNENEIDQDNDLSGVAGGGAGGECAIDQPDDGLTTGEDEETLGDVLNGDDGAECTIGDSEVGDSSTGDSNQANAADEDASNSNSQDQALGDQSNVNEPTHGNNQAVANDLDADAGDGAAGGEATNSGSVDVSNEIVLTLIRILESIIGDDNQDDITLPPVVDEGETPGDGETPTENFCGNIDEGDNVSTLVTVAIELDLLPEGSDGNDLIDLCADVDVDLDLGLIGGVLAVISVDLGI